MELMSRAREGPTLVDQGHGIRGGKSGIAVVSINYKLFAVLFQMSYFCSLNKNFNKMSDISTRVKKIIVDKLGVEEAEVTNEASFTNDLGADSLDTVELVMALEEEFECEIPDEDAEKITTVQQAIDYVKSHQK